MSQGAWSRLRTGAATFMLYTAAASAYAADPASCYRDAAAECEKAFNGPTDAGTCRRFAEEEAPCDMIDMDAYTRDMHALIRTRLPYREELPDVALAPPAPTKTHATRRVAMEMMTGMCRAIGFYRCKHQDTAGRLPFNIVIYGDGNTVPGAIRASQAIVNNPRVIALVGHYTLRNTTVASRAYGNTRLAVISPTAEISQKKFYPNTFTMTNSLQETLEHHFDSLIARPPSFDEAAPDEEQQRPVAVCVDTQKNLSATTDLYGKFRQRAAKEPKKAPIILTPCTAKQDERQAQAIYDAVLRSRADRLLLFLGSDHIGMSLTLMDLLNFPRHDSGGVGPLNVTANSTLLIPALLKERGCRLSFKAPTTEAYAFRVMAGDAHDPTKTLELGDVVTQRTLNTQDALLALAKAFDALNQEDAGTAKDKDGTSLTSWKDVYLGADRATRLAQEDGPLLKKLKSPLFSFSLANDLPDAPSPSAGHVVFYRRRTLQDAFPNEPSAKEIYVTCPQTSACYPP